MVPAENDLAARGAAWLLEQWTAKLSQSLGSMLSGPPRVTASPQPEAVPADGLLWWEETLNILPQPAIRVGAPQACWNRIGQEVLQSAGIADVSDRNIRSTYLEIIKQSLSALIQTIATRVRREVVRTVAAECAPLAQPAYAVEILLGETPLSLFFACCQELLELCAGPAPAQRPVAEPVRPAAPADTDTAAALPLYAKRLDLLLDVELPVSVSFGHAQLPIKDVIKLTTGAIIELNRAVSEPVEVIVNNVVIARGDVVVVEGNFGIRIRQVISRKERLRTLR